MNPNLPRERIVWHPTIDSDACLGDRACLDFCQNAVFVWDDEKDRPMVENPLNCVVGCDACAQVCPVEAITFPDKDELLANLRRLRAEATATGTGGDAASG